MYYGRTFQEKEINIFRCCLILRLPLLQFLLKSVIMGPGSPFLSRDQYLYDSQRKKENCSKMRKKPSQVTDPFQYKLLVMWNLGCTNCLAAGFLFLLDSPAPSLRSLSKWYYVDFATSVLAVSCTSFINSSDHSAALAAFISWPIGEVHWGIHK